MEASVSRAFMKRHLVNRILLSKCHPPPLVLPICQQAKLSFSNANHNHIPKWKGKGKGHTSLFTRTCYQSSVNTRHEGSGSDDKCFEWKLCVDGGEFGFAGEDKRAVVTVVLLGWLGSEQKHLRRYAEMYNLFGMHAVTFAAVVWDVIGLDFGRKVERLTEELVSWVEEKEKDGRERLLIFHNFSNTGWFAYGRILNRLQGRPELIEKIKGCVVDSGGDPDLDPKKWAVGFCTALLKKQNKKQDSTQIFLVMFFCTVFFCMLQIPDVKKKLTNITSTLSQNQPFYPQLYLYSRADTVIPSHKIESFANRQRKLGRKVTTFDFKSTPHVDHYRTFPDTYRSLVQDFLKECFQSNCTT